MPRPEFLVPGATMQGTLTVRKCRTQTGRDFMRYEFTPDDPTYASADVSPILVNVFRSPGASRLTPGEAFRDVGERREVAHKTTSDVLDFERRRFHEINKALRGELAEERANFKLYVKEVPPDENQRLRLELAEANAALDHANDKIARLEGVIDVARSLTKLRASALDVTKENWLARLRIAVENYDGIK